MKKLIKLGFWVFTIALIFTNCKSKNFNIDKNILSYKVEVDTLNVFDSIRNREIPIAIYAPDVEELAGFPIVIFNHGYNYNQPGAYLGYSFITKALAKNGYVVVSVEHDLPSDELLILEGKPQVVRKPSWQKGSDNIDCAIKGLKTSYPKLDYNKITLIGHSNGGDMAVLFTTQHLGSIERLITLDHLRMPFPRTKSPKIYSIRSNDQVADEGVLPTKEEEIEFDMKIVKLENTGHGDMTNQGTLEQQEEINSLILEFVKNK